jgi:NADPH2:quinone reductase
VKGILVRAFGEPEVMQWEELPDPVAGPGQVLVKIEAAGVNPVDTYIRSALHAKRSLPYTPGSDGAGTRMDTGERVYLTGSVTGTYAQLALCQLEQVHPLPGALSFAQGAALYVPYYTAYRALFQCGQARPGEIVLVHGASGGVGLAALQWGRAHGLRMLGTASTPAGLAAIRERGAEAFDHSQSNYLEQMPAPNLILEMLANQNLQKDLEVLAPFGRIVVVGNRGSLDFNARAAMSKEASLRGMSLFNTPAAEMSQIQAAVYAGLEAGFLSPLVGKSFPMSEAAAAHHVVLAPGALGKVVLIA